ncbi:MAG: ComEC family competence protein [Bacteroidetes bacterium]|nr:ComEC family competence protein [Bacteroidota bacterium]
MAYRVKIPFFKSAPFIRLLLPLIFGILLQWHNQFTGTFITILTACNIVALLLFALLPLSVRYSMQSIQGIFIFLLLFATGMLVTFLKDTRHREDWYGHHVQKGDYIVGTINEPLTEKSKTYKAEILVNTVLHGDSVSACSGKMLVYFSKDSMAEQLHYGDVLLLHKDVQPIKNSGNPGAFDYEKYAAMQQLFHNVFLKNNDYVVLNEHHANLFKQFIFTARASILKQLQTHISGHKDELGIAEALLIGYTNDLDKDLVQAYSNTGVVHIIAISGMHLGLIYVLLVWLLARIPIVRKSSWAQLILILASLWLFALLTGASASVLRSAVMFTCISLGKILTKQSSIYNSLAASAFVLLCYNPYFLWDVGFQLSYLAVAGIVIFQKPVYRWLYFKNKWVDKIWQLSSVTLAAQVLTLPVCLYYFHQFPVLFLITNLIAVPLSTIILFAEIALVAVGWMPFLGHYLGMLCGWLVMGMNKIITGFNNLSFSVWDRIPATMLTTYLLYTVIIGTGFWLLQKNKRGLLIALTALLVFVGSQSYYKWQSYRQQKIIVYNVPRQQAVDFVNGRQYSFLGDSILLADAMLQNFHLKPGRIALQVRQRIDISSIAMAQPPFYQFGNSRVVILDQPIAFEIPKQKIPVDLIIISKNSHVKIDELAQVFTCRQLIADASNSLWKIEQWKKDCEQLHLHLHSVPENGAFITDL